MNQQQSYTTAFSVAQTPEQVFDAVTDVRGWWTGEVEGGTHALGDEFTYRVPDVHYCRMRVTELVPAKRVAWLVLDSRLDYLDDKEEWTGTTVTFDISEEDGLTQVRFTHAGLVPEYECYGACSNAWASLVNGSLRGLVTERAGRSS
jgi:uncharacterized protein YndB with AHSA1/START domain